MCLGTKKDSLIRLIPCKLAIFCMSNINMRGIMSTEEPDSAKKIAIESSHPLSNEEAETPQVGAGLIVLGGLCLVIGVYIGLVFAMK